MRQRRGGGTAGDDDLGDRDRENKGAPGGEDAANRSKCANRCSAVTCGLIGAVLVVVALPTLAWNESNAVQAAASLQEARAETDPKSAGGRSNDHRHADSESKPLLYLSGPLDWDGDGEEAPPVVVDPVLGVAVRALSLQRRVDMYQWKQKGKDQGGRYFNDWHDEPVQLPRSQYGYKNPDPEEWPFRSATFYAAGMRLDGFAVGADLLATVTATAADGTTGDAGVDVHVVSAAGRAPHDGPRVIVGGVDLGGDDVGAQVKQKARETLGVGGDALAEAAAGAPVVRGGGRGGGGHPPATEVDASLADDGMVADQGELWSGSPRVPMVGDVRVAFTAVPATEGLTVLAARGSSSSSSSSSSSGGDPPTPTLAPWTAPSGGTFFRAALGRVPASVLLDAMEGEAAARHWGLRVLCAAGLSLGPYLLSQLALFDAAAVPPALGRLGGAVVEARWGAAAVPMLVAAAAAPAAAAPAWLPHRPLVGGTLLAGATVPALLLWALVRRSPRLPGHAAAAAAATAAS